MAVEKGLRSQEKSSTTRHFIDINAIPGLESQRLLPNQKSMHYLSLVKPQMMQRVLSFRGSCEERKAVCMSSHGHMKRCGEEQLMELFPLHPGFATTKSINSRESAHRLEGRSLLSSSEVEGVQPPASSSASPATTPHKQSFTQLSIFYKGTVNAYDVPADKVLTFASPHTLISWVFCLYFSIYCPNTRKFCFGVFVFSNIKFSGHRNGQAQAIMNMLAGNGNAHRLDPDPNIDERETYIAASGSSSNPPIWKAASTNDQKEASMALPVQIDKLRGADLPLSRKQSLQRFLEKRLMRVKSVAPYTSKLVEEDKNEWR